MTRMSELRRLFPYIRPNLHLLILALVLMVISGALEAFIVMLLAPIFNHLTPSGGAAEDKFAFIQEYLGLNQDSFTQIAFFLVVFSFCKGVFLYFAEYSMSFTGQQIVGALRKSLYSHLLNQSLAFYARNATGKLMARIIADTERLQETVSRTLTDFLRQVVLMVLFLGVVFYTDWKLALLSFLIAPLVLFISTNLGRRIRKVSRRSQENLEEISHNLQETIAGQRIVKAFGMEEYERRRFNDSTDQLIHVNLRAGRIAAINSPLIEFIGYVSFVPFLIYANYEMGRGLTIGGFVVFIAALFRLYEPVRKLSRAHLHFQQAFASSQRIFQLLDTHVEITDQPHVRELPPVEKEIAFEGVSFHYQGDDTAASPKGYPGGMLVLNQVDLCIRKREIVALVGPSGAGKTSLASLIPRFYDVNEGRISIDGIDIRNVALRSLRRQIAVVTQETFLFDDSVKNNIAYGREDCTLDEIVEAAQAAFIHDFILSLSHGYDTRIGERGQRLSGGQRQRIAIARAILKKAPILILDEATSALDTESERLVQEALYNLMQNCTTLVIAHRLSTVRLADRIVVMDRGRIVEIGGHEALLEQSGVYRKLYDLQFADGVRA